MQHFTDFLLILHVQLEIVGVNAEAEKIARAAQKVFIGVYRIPVGRGSAPEKAAGNAGSTGSAGKAGNAGSRRQANGAEGKPLRRAVFRYLSGMPCCRRTGTAVPASRRVCSPARLPAAGDGLPRCRGAGTAVPASSPGGKGGKRATRGGLKKGKPGTAGRWETREMQEVRGAREKRGGREAGDKQTAQGKASAPCRIQIYVRPALLPPDRKRRARKPPRGCPGPLPAGARPAAHPPGGRRPLPPLLRRAVCRRSARPARRGSAPAGVRPSTRLPGARAVTAAPRRAVCRRSARPARRGSPAPA